MELDRCLGSAREFRPRKRRAGILCGICRYTRCVYEHKTKVHQRETTNSLRQIHLGASDSAANVTKMFSVVNGELSKFRHKFYSRTTGGLSLRSYVLPPSQPSVKPLQICVTLCQILHLFLFSLLKDKRLKEPKHLTPFLAYQNCCLYFIR